jgi:urease accessory protein
MRAASTGGTDVGPCAAAGRGRLRVARSGARSLVCEAYASSPLKLLTPRNHGRAAWVYTSSYGGGLVDGDEIAVEVTVGPGATAFLSTQASTKVYRSPRGTRADLSADVAAGGLLVLAPDPVVCFAGSRYRQTQQINLADDGALVLIDWLTSGRRAFGERWAFEEYLSRIVIRVGGRLLVHDALALRACDGDLAARLGRFNVLAVAMVIGLPLRAEGAAMAAAVNGIAVATRPDQLLAATLLGEAGCVVRVAGPSVEHVGRTLRRLVGCVPALLGDDPWQRKW